VNFAERLKTPGGITKLKRVLTPRTPLSNLTNQQKAQLQNLRVRLVSTAAGWRIVRLDRNQTLDTTVQLRTIVDVRSLTLRLLGKTA
jgi:hypothetical protein